MQINRILPLIGLIAVIATAASTASATDFYSYTDENGIRVITNIPPVNSGNAVNSTALNDSNTQNPKPSMAIPKADSDAYNPIIKKYASYYELDPFLIHSIIATESGFKSDAVSSKGARGLMQLMPETASRLGVRDSFDPEQNIQAGVRHFRSLMDMFNNDLDLSLAAYNAGENLVKRLGRIPGYTETINYVRSVTRRYNEMRQKDPSPGEVNNSPTFRFVDASGILHITNIPPGR